MAYSVGGLIEASDYNGFQSDTDDVFGIGFSDFTGAITGGRRFFGYGQTMVPVEAAPLVPVAVGQLIDALEWRVLREAIDVCSDHQGTATILPPTTDLDPDDLIQSHPPATGDFPAAITAIRVDPTAVDGGATSLIAPAMSDTRVAAWSNQLTHIFTQTFTSGDAARQWFNSGGQIRIRATRTGGSGTTQNAAWDTLLSAMGLVDFEFDDTDNGGAGTGTTVGYYDLTTSFQQVFSITSAQAGGAAAYDANRVLIQARSTTGPIGPDDTGSQLEFRIDYQDIHVGGGFFDQVDGTFTSFVDLREGDVFLTDPDPSTFRTGAPLTTTSCTSYLFDHTFCWI